MAADENITTRLPAETIDMILDLFCAHHVKWRKLVWPAAKDASEAAMEKADFAVLAALCRVNRRFNGLATPRLYHSLTNSMTASKWLLIARTLIVRPELADLVRHLTLLDDLKASHIHKLYPGEVLDYFAEKAAEFPALLLMPQSHNLVLSLWMGGWGSGRQIDGPLAIMTSLCRKIETLDCIAYNYASVFAFCSPSSVESLRATFGRAIANGWNGPLSLKYLVPLVQAAPKLELLRIERTNEVDRYGYVEQLQSVTTLELRLCYMDIEDLATTLRAFPKLVKLAYQCPTAPPMGAGQFSPQEVVGCVLEHAPNLKEFELNIESYTQYQTFSKSDIQDAKRALESHGIRCEFIVGYEGSKPVFAE